MAAQKTNHVRNVEPSHPPFGGIELEMATIGILFNLHLCAKCSADVYREQQAEQLKTELGKNCSQKSYQLKNSKLVAENVCIQTHNK